MNDVGTRYARLPSPDARISSAFRNSRDAVSIGAGTRRSRGNAKPWALEQELATNPLQDKQRAQQCASMLEELLDENRMPGHDEGRSLRQAETGTRDCVPCEMCRRGGYERCNDCSPRHTGQRGASPCRQPCCNGREHEAEERLLKKKMEGGV